MDRREHVTNDEETLNLMLRGLQSRIWTAMPGIVESFDAAKMTVDVQPAINGRARTKDGKKSAVQLPLLLDCPVLWQGGGGATFTFPIAKGDECLVVFGARCIDGWWRQGFQNPAGEMDDDGRPVNSANNPLSVRMHNLSDGFALVGVRSLPRVFDVDPTLAALRSDDGEAYFTLNPATHAFNMHAPGGITLNGVQIDANGNVQTSATVTADTDVIGGGKHLKTHLHSGVQPGSGNSGAPT